MIINKRKTKQILLKRKSKADEYIKVGAKIIENQNLDISTNGIVELKDIGIYAIFSPKLENFICLNKRDFDSAFSRMKRDR